MFRSLSLALLVSILFVGCATTAPPPTTQMAQARSAVKQAEDVGAVEYAGIEYRKAQAKLEEAQIALAKKKHDKARRLAEQAAVDAEFAAIKARSAKTQQAVNELRESIRLLQQEISRSENR